MRAYKIIGLTVATLAAVTAAVSPAAARPHRHQVCHMERHGHHVTRVCHWVH